MNYKIPADFRPKLSATVADPRRLNHAPRSIRYFFRTIYLYQRCKALKDKHPLLSKVFAFLWWPVFKSIALSWHVLRIINGGCDINLTTKIGLGTYAQHLSATVINKNSTIGINCFLAQHVTIGTTEEGGYPQIGNCVAVGAGAVIIGDVTVGDYANIGANATVTKDVLPGATVVQTNRVISRWGIKCYWGD